MEKGVEVGEWKRGWRGGEEGWKRGWRRGWRRRWKRGGRGWRRGWFTWESLLLLLPSADAAVAFCAPNFKCDNSCNDAAAAAAGDSDNPGVGPTPFRYPAFPVTMLMELPRRAEGGGAWWVSPLP